MIDLSEWQIVTKRTYQAKRIINTTNWEPIPKQQIKINQPSIIVRLTNSKASKHWYFAGKVTLFAVDRRNNQVRISVNRISLKELTLIETNKISSSYLLEFWFPWWHEIMFVEVWEKSHDDCDICTTLSQIKKTVDDISNYEGA